MGGWDEEIEGAYRSWARDFESEMQADDLTLRRSRRCLHLRQDVAGEPFRGRTYLNALQRLRGDAALRVARNVEPFFWSDAERVVVWLCRECSGQLGLRRP